MLKEIEEIPQTVNRIIDNYFQNDEFQFDNDLLNDLNASLSRLSQEERSSLMGEASQRSQG